MEKNVKINCNYFALLLILFGITLTICCANSRVINSNGYVTYYISPNGSDERMCGDTTDTACRTLTYVLYLYYNTSSPSGRGLQIITSRSLVFDQHLVSSFPMLVETNVQISLNENASQPCTVFMKGLNFLKSHWQLFEINVWMAMCDTTFLIMELNYLTNVTIENCTFGNWTFLRVPHFIIKNSRSSILEKFPTSLNFFYSSGLMENITIKDLNFTEMPNGLIIQNNSYIQITKSNFVNNTVTNGVIKVLDLSTMDMSNCNLQKNKAIDLGGAIFTNRSFIYLTKTIFCHNEAVQGGGAIYVTDTSFLYMKNCSFFNNQVKFLKDIHTTGGAIFLSNSTAQGIKVNFTDNRALYGGGLSCISQSKVTLQCMHFSQNIADFGSALYGSTSCKISCINCTLYQNYDTGGAAVTIYNYSSMNVSGFKCEKHRGYYASCISARDNCTVFIYNAIFNMNIGTTLTVADNSHLITSSSSFSNNTTPLADAAAIGSSSSSLYVSHCTFINNSNPAVVLFNTEASIVNCIYKSNTSPDMGGALLMRNNSDVTVSHTTFLENSAVQGGAFYVSDHSSLVIINCSFLMNIAQDIRKNIINKAIQGGGGGTGGAILIVASVLKIFHSGFYSNFAGLAGGSLYCMESSLLIQDSVFQNNNATFLGGSIMIANDSSLIMEDSSLLNNSVLDKENSYGGGLVIIFHSNATISNVHLSENKCGPTGGAALWAGSICKVSVFNSSFVANIGPAIGVIIDVTLQIDHCFFINNSKGAMAASHSSINVTNARFRHHTQLTLWLEDSCDASFYNCLFTDNSAFSGGALYAINSNIKLIASNFTRNTATNGGVFSVHGNLLVVDCIMNSNRAEIHGGVGYIEENSRINITTSIFVENYAGGSGGVLWIRRSSVSLLNSSFMNNMAHINGGVLFAEYSNVTIISQATCYGNKAGTAGILFGRGTTIFVNESTMHQNSAFVSGAISVEDTSVLEISFTQVYQNNAESPTGVLSVSNNSILISRSSVFKRNSINLSFEKLRSVGSINLFNSSGYMENCTFVGSYGKYVGAITIGSSELRLSNTNFLHNIMQEVKYNNLDKFVSFISRIYTYKTIMKRGNITLKSNATNFKQIAFKEHFLQLPFFLHNQDNLVIEETQFASIFPQPCLHNCTCHRSPYSRDNIFDCRNKGLTSIPETVLEDTDQVLLSENNLISLNKVPAYLNNITLLNLSSSNITDIDMMVISAIIKNVKHLDIRGNNLKEIPQTITKSNNVSELWISDNPYECNCGMMWMKDWLVEAKNVVDKDNVTCSGGKLKDIAIYNLDTSFLGCGFPLWAIITLVMGSTAVLVITVILNRKWTSIKFHYYARFTNDDDSQDLSLMKYDAFISYSQPDEDFVETDIINYLEELGFMICWHHRDFMPGTNIAENIADATVHSRRMIIVISRPYVASEWCMKEFRDAHAHATGSGRKKFLIPILFEDVSTGELDMDLKFYLENHTYIKHRNVDDMKKRLLKVMPHVPLFEVRPELKEQDEAHGDTNPEVTVDNVESDTEGMEEANPRGMEDSTTFHDLEEHTVVELGVIERVKRFIFRKKVNGRNNAPRMMRHVTVTVNLRYGHDESSESDNEVDLRDEIPLVRRNQWH